MPKRRCSKGDVQWCVPGKKKPIAYSTISERDTVRLYIEDGFVTPNMVLYALEKKVYIRQPHIAEIMNEYITRGYGDMRFGG